MSAIYLDYNATTPIAPEVQEAMLPFIREHYGNPSSAHPLGRTAREAIERAREQVAGLLGAKPQEIIFTSGGTEANNHALKGVAFADGPAEGHLIISAVEHPAITAPARFLEQQGFEVTVVGCDGEGVIDASDVAEAIRPDTRLVSIMHANNEIGTIQPISALGEICAAKNVLLHTDAAQSAGKIPTKVHELDVHLLSIAGHKLYAPKGVGALYVREGTKLEPFMHGAGHESGRRAGTENTPYIVGLGRAAELAQAHLRDHPDQMTQLRDALARRLKDVLGEKISVNGHPTKRLPNTLSANFEGVLGRDLLEQAGDVFASLGAACHADSVKLSDTMAAIGLPPERARGTIRLSVGRPTTATEIERAADLLIDAYKRLAPT